jgi:hypothetical protein
VTDRFGERRGIANVATPSELELGDHSFAEAVSIRKNRSAGGDRGEKVRQEFVHRVLRDRHIRCRKRELDVLGGKVAIDRYNAPARQEIRESRSHESPVWFVERTRDKKTIVRGEIR